MADKNTILGYFNTNDKPTENQYAAWIIDTYDCINNLTLHISTFNHDDIAATKAKVDAMTSAITIFDASNGQPNIAVGSGALGDEVTLYVEGLTIPATPLPIGYKNIIVGKDSYKTNVGGHDNICLGMYSSSSSTDSNYNITIGNGNLVGVSGDNNITIGHGIMTNVNNTAGSNIVLGNNSLIGLNTTTQTKNIVIGKDSANYITTGSDNIVIGSQCCPSVNPAQSIFIGNNATSMFAETVNSIVIGHGAVGYNSNEVIIGNVQNENVFLNGIVNITPSMIDPNYSYTLFSQSICIGGLATKVSYLTFGMHYIHYNENVMLCDASVANVEIYFPSTMAELNNGHQYTIKKVDSSLNKVLISSQDGVSMEGISNGYYTLDTEGDAVTFTLYDDFWYVINRVTDINKATML